MTEVTAYLGGERFTFVLRGEQLALEEHLREKGLQTPDVTIPGLGDELFSWSELWDVYVWSNFLQADAYRNTVLSAQVRRFVLNARGDDPL